MPLEMRVQCEKCSLPLDLTSDAYICSYECTFCPDCTEKMGRMCPNCKGDLYRRPTRKRTTSTIRHPDNIAAKALALEADTRRRIWSQITDISERYFDTIRERRVSPICTPQSLRRRLSEFDFEKSIDPQAVFQFVTDNLWENQVHNAHPRYFGLFNPTPTAMGVFADALNAAFNPQLAAWRSAPFAVELEQHLLTTIAKKLGYAAHECEGTFASGGAEANHTAILNALTWHFPVFDSSGLLGMTVRPTIYVSEEAHHSFLKAARLCGLGSSAVREVPTKKDLSLDVDALRSCIHDDRAKGCKPFMVVATIGTTSAGAVDPVREIASLARSEGLWFHVDAAWGGLAVLLPELGHLFDGIGLADSITVDAHKMMSVPMGAGIYLGRHRGLLEKTFRVAANYMTVENSQEKVVEPFAASMQWSRRFIGLKVFMSLAAAGWDGYAAMVRHKIQMGNVLRHQLKANGWAIANDTVLPLVCFHDGKSSADTAAERLDRICQHVLSTGKAWLSTTKIRKATTVLRACITSFRTTEEDLDVLVGALAEAANKCALAR